MKTTKPPDPLVIMSTSPADDEGIEIVKAWVKENNYTSDTVSIKKTKFSVYAEMKS